MIYLILSLVLVVTLLAAWWVWRYDYRRFQKMYRVKLPFLCIVTLTKEKDKIIRGNKRYRFIRKDGHRDRRRAMNFKWTYPTIIVVNKFKLKVYDLKKSNELFLYLEPYMDLSLDDCPYWGQIEGDLYKYFGGNQILFQRYCGKLLQFYGWRCEIIKDGYRHLMALHENKMWNVCCLLKREPVYQQDIQNLLNLKLQDRWLVITNTKYSNGAVELAFANGVSLMDGKCIDSTFLHERIRVL